MKKRITFSIDEDIINRLRDISEQTMIPQSRILETALKEKLEQMESTMK